MSDRRLKEILDLVALNSTSGEEDVVFAELRKEVNRLRKFEKHVLSGKWEEQRKDDIERAQMEAFS
jgi:hypothetical protein